jgi:hypothetical protein
MEYKEIFSLCVQHGYNAGGDCPDLSLQPSADTQAKLDGHKMMWKKLGSRYQLIAAFDGPGSLLVPPASSLVLDFELLISRPAFHAYTEFPDFAGDRRFYFDNALASDSPLGGKVLVTSAAPQDLSLGKAIGRLRIGLASLLPLAPSPISYLLQMEAAATTWQYCVLSRPQLADPVIEDLDQPGAFVRTALTAGSGLSPLLENLRLQLADLYPDRNFFHFASPAPITWRAAGRKNLVLKDGLDLVMDHLANPSSTHPSMVFIHA